MTVLIAGAGITGLTLAISCQQAGIPFAIFEQVSEIKPLGVGINVQPHAIRELFEMGLEAELEATGVRTREVSYFSKKGGLIWSEPRGQFAGYKWPQYSVHRGTFQMMLLKALQDIAGADVVKTDRRAVNVVDTENGVRVTLRNRAGKESAIEGTVLIACDGIHSDIRAKFYPDEGAPHWGGSILWRGTARGKPFITEATMGMAGHEWQKFVTYPISKTDPETGEAEINWIAELKFPPDKKWNREDYNRKGNFDDFFPAFADWKFDWLDIPKLMQDGGYCYEFPMVDRDPVEQWTFGSTTLAGDAAHAMYPIGSNGASQGILDARVLVREFLKHGVGVAALQAYEAERRPATTRLVMANRGNGPDHVMNIVEERCEGAFDDISEVLSREELSETAAAYKKIAGMDVEGLNNRASIVELPEKDVA
ncbi:FAD-dependent monooxygenase [Rhizobium sp. L1K21]|uniref:flavin-dependent oxidoreductase n=1 Tax=Rhizobium sp. L1K21 TaxID=2954933 RepID=UPI002092D1DA|nr:flavin-dependent oxidoreductase [Rhizobium sp. L1K21]